jgi:hypothetical protein
MILDACHPYLIQFSSALDPLMHISHYPRASKYSLGRPSLCRRGACVQYPAQARRKRKKKNTKNPGVGPGEM